MEDAKPLTFFDLRISDPAFGPNSGNILTTILFSMASKGCAAITGRISVGRPVCNSTLLPFLYQTRTLQPLLLSRKHGLRGQSRNGQIYRHLATSKAQSSSRHEIPFDTIPFEESEDRGRSRDHSLFQDDFDLDSEEQIEPRHRDSTITASEQAVFTRLFDNLVESLPETEEKDEDFLDDGEGKGFKEDLNSVFGAAVKSAKSKARRKEKRDAFQSLEDHERFFLTRYPEPLRAAAARTSGILAHRAQRDIRIRKRLSAVRQPPRPVAEMNVYERVIRQERQAQLRKVEGLLRSAETDFELWNVLEKEVFSTIKKLEVASAGEGKPKPPQRPRRGRPKKEVLPTVQNVEVNSLVEVASDTRQTPEGGQSKKVRTDADAETKPQREVLPALEIVGPNYPSHCLLALRLLHDKFPTSPLALNILPAIKRAGPTSYVLGATTALYNELLSIHWLVYNNMRAMADLLTEMDEQDVGFSQETVAILELPAWERDAVKAGKKGRSLAALWEMEEMEAAFARLQALRRVVHSKLDQERRRESDALALRDEIEARRRKPWDFSAKAAPQQQTATMP